MNLAKTYTPNQYEPMTYALWETAEAFAPTGEGRPYGVVMPPPNANGDLHIGHGLDMTLKDILVRHRRMKGDDAIFIPGADHAGFETWVVYEKKLTKEGKNRFDFSREQLYAQVWDFVAARRGDMELQLRALGVGASWQHSVFTLDKKVIDITYQTFEKMWNDDLIYRGERLVNYCTEHQTSFADIEVEHETVKGKLYKIAYPLLENVGEIIVATTRPETMLGDTAIAVHPDDKRYKHLVGSHVQLPLIGREIKIIADSYVDKDFGTGAVKVTPAHDPNDYDMGQRHDLDTIQVIGTDGHMTNEASQFAGLDIATARKRVLAALEASELLRGEEPIEHSVAHCYKCKTVIQPLLMDQWFIRTRPLADKAIERLEAGEIKFYPASKKKEVVNYLKQLRDWNISRQIAWGIPIPAFVNINDSNDWIFDTRVEENTIIVNGTTFKREEDTFDTWFSSGQWPYVVTDALNEGELSRFFPTAVMETGSDLLRQWVSRMIMLSVYRTNQVPFKDVYFHGMVNDEHNQKMSKSKGNVINPMEMVSKYGSDAFRMGIIANRSPAANQAFSPSSVVAGRNFCNKLWNMARYIEGKLGSAYKFQPPKPKTTADHWVISELLSAADRVTAHLDKYRFSEASEVVYQTIWTSVADWYIEASKVDTNPDMLAWVLDTSLKITHPFAPFVTETIWQALPWYSNGTLLTLEKWPKPIDYSEISAGQFEQLQSLIGEIRIVTGNMPGNKKYTLLYGVDTLIADNTELITHLGKLKGAEQSENASGVRLASYSREAWLDIDKSTLDEYSSNLEIRLSETHKEIKRLQERLNTPSYLDRAPEHLVEETRQQLAEKEALVGRLQAEIEVINH
ncbi:valine--tRNA ligase [Candidatus Nomurabacteria bacterium]|nr:valine--tRNA ligase [Candidatus Nomurabacteria bacterium]